MRVEINELENRKPVEKIKVTKNCFFERLTKLAKLWPDWPREKGLKLLDSEIKEGNIITGIRKMERIIKEYCEQLYTTKLHSLDKMDTFLERCWNWFI